MQGSNTLSPNYQIIKTKNEGIIAVELPVVWPVLTKPTCGLKSVT